MSKPPESDDIHERRDEIAGRLAHDILVDNIWVEIGPLDTLSRLEGIDGFSVEKWLEDLISSGLDGYAEGLMSALETKLVKARGCLNRINQLDPDALSGPSYDAGCMIDEIGKIPENAHEFPVQRALLNLRNVLAETRGQHGRDFIRRLPQGKLLDALDANRECGFPEDYL